VGVFKFAKIQMKSKKNEKHVGTLNIIMPPSCTLYREKIVPKVITSSIFLNKGISVRCNHHLFTIGGNKKKIEK
jgi:hypothetical protein